MTPADRQNEIQLWLNQQDRFRMADCLRYAAWQMMEEVEGYTSGDFADDCAALGLHHQASRNRFNEARNNLLDAGMLPA